MNGRRHLERDEWVFRVRKFSRNSLWISARTGRTARILSRWRASSEFEEHGGRPEQNVARLKALRLARDAAENPPVAEHRARSWGTPIIRVQRRHRWKC
jgi:hypothetical protein